MHRPTVPGEGEKEEEMTELKMTVELLATILKREDVTLKGVVVDNDGDLGMLVVADCELLGWTPIPKTTVETRVN